MRDQLKIIALDVEDLKIISAHCQDAVLKVSDIRFSASENRMILALNRFVWEKGAGKKTVPERRRSALHFERVLKVSSQGLNLSAKETVLSLLAIKFETSLEPSGTIDLLFANDITIKLEVECIEVQLSDMLAAWEASSKPKHPGV